MNLTFNKILKTFVKDKTRFEIINNLYKAKYEKYNELETFVIVLSTFANIVYYITDCYISQRIILETIVFRFAPIFSMFIALIISKSQLDYKTKLLSIYVHLHFCTVMMIMSMYFLDDTKHAQEGFIVLHFLFLGVAIVSPLRISVISHSFMIINIMLSSLIIHNYYHIELIYITNIVCIGGVAIIASTIDKTYTESYIKDLKLEDLSIRDQLTKAYNRNIIKSITDDLGRPLQEKAFIIMIDIDKFKNINDTYGHGNGDVILKSVANIVRDNIRDDDMFIRWGGEEFIVYLKYAYYEKAKFIAERIRTEVESSKNGICDVTISLGVSSCSRDIELEKSIENADKALYYSKNNGRNRTTLYADIR